jgi:hypothetical protein
VIDGPQSGTENTPSAEGLVPGRRLLNCIAAVRISEGPSPLLGSFSFTGLPVSMDEFKRLTTKFQQKRGARRG